MNEPVFLDVTDRLAWFILSRPDRGNAISQAMADTLLESRKPDISSAPLGGS